MNEPVKIYVLKDFKGGMFQHSLVPAIEKLETIKEKGVLILCLSDIFMRSDKTYIYAYYHEKEKYIDADKHVKSQGKQK